MLTLDQARERLRRAGKSASDVARELNVDRAVVVNLLSGRVKGLRGDAHKVAVHLGLKEGVIVPDDMPIREAMKLAGGAR